MYENRTYGPIAVNPRPPYPETDIVTARFHMQCLRFCFNFFGRFLRSHSIPTFVYVHIGNIVGKMIFFGDVWQSGLKARNKMIMFSIKSHFVNSIPSLERFDDYFINLWFMMAYRWFPPDESYELC